MEACEMTFGSGGADAGSVSVLVVEDETLLRMMLSDYLNEAGFNVLEAFNADDAIRVIETNDVDVVFSDVHMPGQMDGFGLARWVHCHRPGTPVLLTSGVANKYEAAKEGVDADSFLSKPYDLSILAEEIRRHSRH